MKLHVTPQPLSGVVTAPPSKSYAHRYCIASFLAGTPVRLVNAGFSKDVEATLGALQSLGLRVEKNGADRLLYRSTFLPECATLYCNESGSTMRFLMPVVAALGVHATFTGEAGLLSRPIEGLVDVLNEHGADIQGLTVQGKLSAGTYVVDATVSSQYVSGLLFALPLLDGDSRLVLTGEMVSKRYVDITLDVLRTFGVHVSHLSDGYAIAGNQRYVAPEATIVEGDYSGAAFWLAAGALGKGILVKGLNPRSTQGDVAILSCLAQFGAEVQVQKERIVVAGRPLQGTVIDVDAIPDLAQILSVLAAFAKGETTLRNVGRLRLKESDRLNAIIDTLHAAKIECDLADNDLHIKGGVPIGADFAGGNDHRTVMATAILAAFAKGDSTITDVEATGKSYPDFVKDFASLGGNADVTL